MIDKACDGPPRQRYGQNLLANDLATPLNWLRRPDASGSNPIATGAIARNIDVGARFGRVEDRVFRLEQEVKKQTKSPN